MKLLGAIAVLVILATSCQKEDIRPNAASPAAVVRSSDAPTSGGTVDEGNVEGSGGAITDPNDANRTNKNPKPKQ